MADIFERVDAYIDGLFIEEDDGLRAAAASSTDGIIPDIRISGGQGKFLYLLAKLTGASRILEIGTLVGYSTIWMARALPEDGKLVSLEFDPHHAGVARRNIEKAGVADKVEVITGDAHETLEGMIAEGAAPFDLIFLDAEKPGYPDYLPKMLKLSRAGTLIAGDNVVRKGEVLDPQDEFAEGAARFNALLAAEPSVEAVILQQVGIKGHDGLALARVR
ncbi:O-methyltransferase [Parvularcula flava]|uniref:O-methyltransferase n=1 Tax=Aquisalinus luteolus TaxID=1566827 RepID=A0A8J3EQN0_9PROT|nr:O-methyltransferase [Aquisalinus luteolus]NHK27461.1 O-methyltransferase [Aquisalinus luteolus]GGH95508.1 O-methyltransferase [Aquisalinus luteolus]